MGWPKGADGLLAYGSAVREASSRNEMSNYFGSNDTDQPFWMEGRARSERCEVCNKVIGYHKFVVIGRDDQAIVNWGEVSLGASPTWRLKHDPEDKGQQFVKRWTGVDGQPREEWFDSTYQSARQTCARNVENYQRMTAARKTVVNAQGQRRKPMGPREWATKRRLGR